MGYTTYAEPAPTIMPNVLYVEEGASPVEPIVMLLKMTEELDISVARSGREGMEFLGSGEFDLMIYSCENIGEEERHFLSAIEQKVARLPIIALTGEGDFGELGLPNCIRVDRNADLTRQLAYVAGHIRNMTGQGRNDQ